MNRLKELLADVDSMDRIQLRANINRFFVFERLGNELSTMRLVLKKILLEEILKVEVENRNVFSESLKEILSILRNKSKGYSCCFSGCRFEAERHRHYVKHIRTTHPRATNIPCNFKKVCLRNFVCIESLVRHIKEDHSALPCTAGTSTHTVVSIDVPCRCNLISCGSKHFSNVKELLTHLNTFHHKDVRECVFENCNHRFAPFSVSRHHFRNNHTKKNDLKLKAKHLLDLPNLQPPSLGPPSFQSDEVAESHEEDNIEVYNAFDIDDIENDDAEHEDENEEYFLQYYADFLNRLVHHKFIPQSTVQDIAEEYFRNSKKSQVIREKKLRASLSEVPNLSVDEVNKIVKDVIEDDFFLKAQEQLNTQYKRTKYVQENMRYVGPVEILLNKSEVEKGQKKDVIHYVPMEAAMKNLLEDKSVRRMFQAEENKEPTDPGKITDIKDGSLLKTNKYFQDNPDALAFLFYSDGVELKNPLGAARGTYKVVQVFFTLVNIPKNQRSQVDRLQLGMIFKEKLLKKYSFEVIYKHLVKDLVKLERGILINIPEPKVVKFGLLLYAADNLEAHQLGGFSSCFSSKSICRHCHIQYDQLDENIHDMDGEEPHARWTVQEYDSIISSIEDQEMTEDVEDVVEMESLIAADEDDFDDEGSEDGEDDNDGEEGIIDNRWIKSRCPLNILQSFHCVNGFPPDLLHDFLEGVVAEDLLSIIKTLSSKAWFSIDEYNEALKDFGWFSYETTDKPLGVPTARKIVKLKGKAVSQWVHSRNWPLVMKKFIADKDDAVLKLGLKLHEVTERLTATEYHEYEIDLLGEAIVDYLDMRKEIRLEFPESFKRPKPKHHFLREIVKIEAHFF